MSTKITQADITEMVKHWLTTPPEGYLGSPYGADVKSLLQRPQGDQSAFRAFMQKMYKDLPVLSVLPEGSVTAYMKRDGTEQAKLVINVAGTLVESA